MAAHGFPPSLRSSPSTPVAAALEPKREDKKLSRRLLLPSRPVELFMTASWRVPSCLEREGASAEGRIGRRRGEESVEPAAVSAAGLRGRTFHVSWMKKRDCHERKSIRKRSQKETELRISWGVRTRDEEREEDEEEEEKEE